MSEPRPRLVERGGTVYQQDTSAIGRREAEEPKVV
jgi:hypothetical protein